MRRDVSPNFRTLATAQAAIAVEILIYLPIRMQNLIRLTFDVHLFLHEGAGAVSTLDISAGEVNNKRPIEFDIPPHIVRMLIEYREHLHFSAWPAEDRPCGLSHSDGATFSTKSGAETTCPPRQ